MIKRFLKIRLNSNFLCLCLFFALIILNSCKKKTEIDTEVQSAIDNALCEDRFMGIISDINANASHFMGLKKSTSVCENWSILGALGNPTITPSMNDTIDKNQDGFYDNGAVTFEFDYGAGCLSSDGQSIKKGIISITSSKRWVVLNHPIIIKLKNYKIDDLNYSGKIVLTRTDSLKYSVQVTDGHCTNGSWIIDFECSNSLEQTEGYTTKNNQTDDVILISGNSNGKNRENKLFTATIKNSLVKKSNCRWISSGVLELTPQGLETRIIDFGNNSCDDKAKYTLNGNTIGFKLN
jgi:hypothetical protein